MSNKLKEIEWQQLKRNNDYTTVKAVTITVLIMIGLFTVMFLVYTGTQSHYRAKFEKENVRKASILADAQVKIAELEALREGRMDTVPLVLHRIQKFINE